MCLGLRGPFEVRDIQTEIDSVRDIGSISLQYVELFDLGLENRGYHLTNLIDKIWGLRQRIRQFPATIIVIHNKLC